FKASLRRRTVQTPKPVVVLPPTSAGALTGPASFSARLRPYGLKRFPSWCDRILWRTINTGSASDLAFPSSAASVMSAATATKLISYQACENVLSSDHLPVKASFVVHAPLFEEGAIPIKSFTESCEVVISYLCCHLNLPQESTS